MVYMILVSTKNQTDALIGILMILVIVSLLPLAIACSPIILGYYLKKRWKKRQTFREVRETWLPQGKRVLFFYSNRAIWKSYFEERFIPRLQDQAIIWNWSERESLGWNEDLLEARVLRLLVGRRAFCPCAILFSPTQPARLFFFADAYIRSLKSRKPDFPEQERAFFTALEGES